MMLLYKGKKCCKGKRGGIYIHLKGGGKRYLTKAQKKLVKKKKKKGKGLSSFLKTASQLPLKINTKKVGLLASALKTAKLLK